MFSSSLVFKSKRDGELCRCYLDCVFLLCGLSTVSALAASKYLTNRVVMKHHLSVTVQLVFQLQRNLFTDRGSILNALPLDTFLVGHCNLTAECKDEYWSINCSNSSLSSRKQCLLVTADSSKSTTRGSAGLYSQSSMNSKENK